jgi:hypothetical protein
MLPFTPAAAVSDQPSTTLVRWRVFDTASGERHLVGYAIETGRERVSTEVAQLDVRQLRANTSSGRVYELRGAPDEGSTAEYVWTWWAMTNAIRGWRDTTEDVLAAHLRSKN